MQLKDMPDSIIEKAKRWLKKNPKPRSYWCTLDPLPKKGGYRQVLKRQVSPVREGTLTALIKNLENVAVTASKRGATQTFVDHSVIRIYASRPETQKEFERRYENALIERAAVLLMRKVITAEDRRPVMERLLDSIQQLGVAESKKIIDDLVARNARNK